MSEGAEFAYCCSVYCYVCTETEFISSSEVSTRRLFHLYVSSHGLHEVPNQISLFLSLLLLPLLVLRVLVLVVLFPEWASVCVEE